MLLVVRTELIIFLCLLTLARGPKIKLFINSFFLQIYFDVIEEIDCIIDKHVCTVILTLWNCPSV